MSFFLAKNPDDFIQVTQHLREVFWIAEAQTSLILYVSPGAAEIWGERATLASSTRTDWLEGIHGEDQERLPSREQMTSNNGELDLEYRVVRSDGSLRWIHERIFPLRNASGVIHHFAGIAEDVTEYRHAHATSEQQMNATGLSLVQEKAIRERERSYIGREIHDNLGGILSYIRLDCTRLLASLQGEFEKDRREYTVKKLRALIEVLDSAIKIVQRISVELRPVLLDQCGLASAIQWQARQFQERAGIECRCLASGAVEAANHDQALLLFRIVQEALVNVIRHANARTVGIELRERSGNLVLVIRDDGTGITANQLEDPLSYGLLGMKERARLAGGTVSIQGVAGKGTTITVNVPVHNRTQSRSVEADLCDSRESV